MLIYQIVYLNSLSNSETLSVFNQHRMLPPDWLLIKSANTPVIAPMCLTEVPIHMCMLLISLYFFGIAYFHYQDAFHIFQKEIHVHVISTFVDFKEQFRHNDFKQDYEGN